MLENTLLIAILIIVGVLILIPLVLFAWIYVKDVRQKQHSILRNYPVLGRIRYMIEKTGPEFRQYLFENNREGKPFNRNEFEYVYKTGKYNKRIIGFGSERSFEEAGLYIVNDMFPKQWSEMKIEQTPKINTVTYEIENEKLLGRNEHASFTQLDPYLLPDEEAIVLGNDTVREPFKIKGIIGQSAMSYGSLGKNAITALSKGLGLAGGTWMNTGEGGLSSHHLKGETDIIMQISSGLFGVRTPEGEFSWEEFKKNSQIDNVKAFELKIAQGAKQRGGHVEGEKVTEEIAEIRKITPWESVESPNRFKEFSDAKGMLEFVEQMRTVGGKPVGIKIVIGDEAQIEKLILVMKETNIIPDFITIDGGEGGSGATYYELANSVGLPAFAALPLLDDMLKKHGLRDRTHIIASGKLLTPDKIAIALSLGADLINIARGFMLSVGCIMAQVCHTNECPVGVATTNPKLENALSVEEKKYRVCNYLLSLRQGIFEMAAVAGLDSPRKFTREHVVFKDEFNQVTKVGNYEKIG